MQINSVDSTETFVEILNTTDTESEVRVDVESTAGEFVGDEVSLLQEVGPAAESTDDVQFNIELSNETSGIGVTATVNEGVDCSISAELGEFTTPPT